MLTIVAGCDVKRIAHRSHSALSFPRRSHLCSVFLLFSVQTPTRVTRKYTTNQGHSKIASIGSFPAEEVTDLETGGPVEIRRQKKILQFGLSVTRVW